MSTRTQQATEHAGAYQQDDRNVEHEGAETVQEEGEQADVVDLVHGDLGDLPEERNHAVHDSAHGGKVVDRHEGVHLVLGRAQQGLDQVEADSLEDDTKDLEDETNPDELDLTEGGDYDTNDDGRDVEQHLHVGSSNAHGPTGQKHGDRGGGLEHLDEGDTEVQVGQVAADQTQTEEDTDGHNGAQVDAARHLDSLATIEEVGVAGQDLRHDRGKGQVVGSQDHGVAWRVRRLSYPDRGK